MNAIRLELLLMYQQSLRAKYLVEHLKEDWLRLYEIERAVEEIQGGCSCSHTETIEGLAAAYLSGAAA